jgi:hypothetical protein
MNRLLLLSLVLAWQPSHAFCSKPSAPYCATGYGEFTSQWDFDSCKRAVKSYLADLHSYVNCVADEAASDADEIITAFNRKAKG